MRDELICHVPKVVAQAAANTEAWWVAMDQRIAMHLGRNGRRALSKDFAGVPTNEPNHVVRNA